MLAVPRVGLAVWAVGDGIYLSDRRGTYVEYTLLDTTWRGRVAGRRWLADCARTAVRLDTRRLQRHARRPRPFTLIALGLLVADHYAPSTTRAIWLCAAILAGRSCASR